MSSYLNRRRLPKVGSFVTLLRQLSQEHSESLYQVQLKPQAESEPSHLPSCRRRASRPTSS